MRMPNPDSRMSDCDLSVVPLSKMHFKPSISATSDKPITNHDKQTMMIEI